MTRSLLALILILTTHASWSAEPRRVAFERGTDIWIANLDGTETKKITRGTQPSISSDGARIAFHTDSSGAKELIRHIAVADVASKKITVFKKEIPSDNCQHAVWSPDGSQIVFSLYTGDDWHLGLINADGSDFRYLKKAPSKGSSFWSTTWAPDSKSVYVQDLDKIVQLDLTGTEMKTWNLHTLFPKGGLSSASEMSVSPDGDRLVIEVEVDEEVNRKDWDGPPPSIWAIDLAAEKVARLTPKGFFGWDPVWLSNDQILFVSQGAKEKQPSLYQMSREGEERKQLIKNANAPSVSR
jgi:TolB protein